MAKGKRKPIWLKILIWILSVVFSIVALLGVGCGFLYIKYQINVFDVVNQVRILNQEVNLEKLAPNVFTIDDMASAKTITDANLNGLISYTEEEGYKITPEKISTNMLGELKFTDKQIGAILNNIIECQEEINIQLGSTINLKNYGFKLVQVAFSEITAVTTDFNVVIKIDLSKIKEEKMSNFPFNLIKKGIPDSLYFSSTITLTQGTNAFDYTTESKSLLINNLSSDQTESVFKTINNFIKLGSSKEFSKIIGDTFVNVLIGNETKPGFAYSLKDVGATDFSFETVESNNYFIIQK